MIDRVLLRGEPAAELQPLVQRVRADAQSVRDLPDWIPPHCDPPLGTLLRNARRAVDAPHPV